MAGVKATYHPKRMDTDRNARVCWDPFWSIRIHNSKKLTCVHVHSSWARIAVAVQQGTTTSTSLCLPPPELRSPNRNRGMQNVAQRINYGTHQVQGIGGRVARLYCYRRRVWTWRRRSGAWGEHAMYPRFIPLGMARGYKTRHRILN